MATETFERKLVAIVAADVVGYSRLMGADEAGTHTRLKNLREQVIEPQIATYHGRIVKLMGDGILAEFPSVVDALACSVEVQRAVATRNTDTTDDQHIVFRIGINLGDVIVEGDDLYGDGVNIAARLEPLAEPGGICISQAACDFVGNKLPLDYKDMGKQHVKNIAEPVRAYRVDVPTDAVMPTGSGIEPSQVSAIETQTAQKTPAKTWRRVGLAAAIVILLGVGAVLWYQPWVTWVDAASEARMAFPLPSKPSIAVLPFMNLSDDPEQEYFADGLSNDIMTDLSKFSTLFVVAANSTFRYKGKPVKVQQVAEDLGVRYVLEGSVQRLGDTLRINAQLIDALSGRHVWAERYDREARDLFAIQNEITRNVVGIIYPLAEGRGKLQKAELERIQQTAPEHLKAYDYFLQAMRYIDAGNKEDNERSKEMFKKALELDPGLGRAWGKHTWNYLADYWNGWSDDPQASLAQAMEIAKKGIAVDPNEGWTHYGLGLAYMIQKQHDLALQEFEKAVALNPNDASLIIDHGWCLTWAGRPNEGLPLMKKAMRLNPYHPDWYWSVLWLAHFMAGQYEEALSILEKLSKPWAKVYRRFAVTYAMLDRMDEAQAAMAKYRELEPQNTVEQAAATMPFKRPEDLERYLNALRKAGMPEKPPLPLPNKLSIAVLPFDNLSGEARYERLADGLSEDIITDLSRFRELFVIARNSTFSYKGKATDVRQIARELGVQYVLEGSLQIEAEQLRLTAQLIDAVTGNHVWSQRYDRALDYIFAIQDEITQSVTAQLGGLDGALARASRETARRKPPANRQAYDYYLLGVEAKERFTKSDLRQAQALFDQALVLDPGLARAYVGLAHIYSMELEMGVSESAQQSQDSWLKSIQQAIALDPYDGEARFMLAYYYQVLNDYDRAVTELDRSLTLNPNNADVLALATLLLIKAGVPERALASIEQAIRLNPHHVDWYFGPLSDAYFFNRRFAEAIATNQRRLTPNPQMDPLRRAMSYGQLGRQQNAAAEVQLLLDHTPDYSAEKFLSDNGVYSREIELNLFLDSHGKVGLPICATQVQLQKYPHMKRLTQCERQVGSG